MSVKKTDTTMTLYLSRTRLNAFIKYNNFENIRGIGSMNSAYVYNNCKTSSLAFMRHILRAILSLIKIGFLV